jgi:4'-phosphopantetheinyl transferase
MSLASHLLKHLIITKYASNSWKESIVSRDEHGKPYFLPQPGMDFNVSHQAGIVSLIAVVGIKGGEKVEVGTDVVCVNERLVQDYAHIEKEGFFEWVDIHGDVFSEGEVSYMKLAPVSLALPFPKIPTGFGKDAISRCQWRNQKVRITVQGPGDEEKILDVDSNTIVDAKLRRFYACWCLREAYIKMTGEALLAPWLKELEISDVKAPAAPSLITDEALLEGGKPERDFTIHFKGKRVTNAEMELVAMGKEFMVGCAVRPAQRLEELGLGLGRWEWLDLERDVLAFAESRY